MVDLLVPLLVGLLMLFSGQSRMRQELYGSGMFFLVIGLVLLLHTGLDVGGVAHAGLPVGWISQPSLCVHIGQVHC
jgi:hypothetical protein